MKTFREFIDRKTRESKRQLTMIKKILEQDGVEIKDYLNEEEPYLYMKSPGNKVSFGGVRIYKVLGSLGYRVQKEENTHPYGKAYALPVEEMYDDYLEDDAKPKEAAEEVASGVIEELKTFFQKSAEAEKELNQGEFDRQGDALGKVMIKTTGTDYSNTVHSKTNY